MSNYLELDCLHESVRTNEHIAKKTQESERKSAKPLVSGVFGYNKLINHADQKNKKLPMVLHHCSNTINVF